jgi:hypothetical protein
MIVILMITRGFRIFCNSCGAIKIIYVDKNEAITLAQSGFGWTLEMHNTPGQSHNMFRMDASLFRMLHNLLVNKYGLECHRYT